MRVCEFAISDPKGTARRGSTGHWLATAQLASASPKNRQSVRQCMERERNLSDYKHRCDDPQRRPSRHCC